MQIIPFEEKYRDDMIFMVLEAKDALGRVPGLNEELLDIRKNYLDYVKAALKRQGIGTKLYLCAEEHLRKIGKRAILVHLGGKGFEASRLFYRRFGYEYEQDENYMRKMLEK